MPYFPLDLKLSSLDGTNGFQINGEAANDKSGWSVASAGDVNNDGFDDVIVGAYGATTKNLANSGASYVIFGKAGGFGNGTGTLNLTILDGTNGFKINGAAQNDVSGTSVSSAGDVNGDLIDDLIIGSPNSDPNGTNNAGAAFVVFGLDSKAGKAFSASVDLSGLNGANGFKISGELSFDGVGRPVAAAGDVNGDGFGDVIVGGYGSDVNGILSGASYVVFGKAGGFGDGVGNLDLSTLDGKNGFQINGEQAGDTSGNSVASAGDVNGDGIGDLIIGARTSGANGPRMGTSYVVFGKDTANAGDFAATVELSALDGANGFQINGETFYDQSGFSVASAGDVNGDGIGDLIIGAPYADPNGNFSGASYVVFGKDTTNAGDFTATVELSAFDGTNGFQINGESSSDYSGHSVASAGDINGDGFDDLLIGALYAQGDAVYSGVSYVIFGKPGGFAANVELASPNGRNGFKISGEADLDTAGRSVASAGDINADGFDDLIIGADRVVVNGKNSGASYVVFGHATPVNNAPSGVNKTLGVNQGNSYTFSATNFGFGDALDNPFPDALQSVIITTLPANGTLTLNGIAVVAGVPILAAQIGGLVWTPAANTSGTGLGLFTFQVVDTGGTVNGGQNTDQTPNTIDFIVSAATINSDAPTGTDRTIGLNAGASYSFTPTTFGFVDALDSPANSFQSVIITTLPTNGTLTLVGNPVIAGTAISISELVGLVWTPDNGATGVDLGSFTFQVVDDGPAGNGNQNTDQTPNTINFIIGKATPFNDAPSGADKTVTIAEETPYSFDATDFGFSDALDAAANALQSVIITKLPASGTLALNGIYIAAGATISASELNHLVWIPAANAHGNALGSFTFQVVDDGGVLNNGQNTDQTPNTISFNVVSINDAPSGADRIISIAAGTFHSFIGANFGFADTLDSPANLLQSVIITTLPANGTLRVGGVAVTVGQVIPAASIGTLVWTPAQDAAGNGLGSFTFQVVDNGGTANGGQNTDQSANTISFNVAAVNDAPTGTDKTIPVNEEVVVALTEDDFLFADADGGIFTSVTIVKTATKGVLKSGPGLEGVVKDGAVIQFADLDKLTFVSAKNGFGNDYDNFTFKVTSEDGVSDLIANTMMFDVTDVVDIINGTRKNNKILGTTGSDIIDGKGGKDRLTGGLGDDTLIGGKGKTKDTFVFNIGDGKDTIKDFYAKLGSAHDIIDIKALSDIDNIKDLKKNHTTQVGRDVVIDYDGVKGDGDTITLKNVTMRDLDAGDFLF